MPLPYGTSGCEGQEGVSEINGFFHAFPEPVLSPSIDFIEFHFVLATFDGNPLLL